MSHARNKMSLYLHRQVININFQIDFYCKQTDYDLETF